MFPSMFIQPSANYGHATKVVGLETTVAERTWFVPVGIGTTLLLVTSSFACPNETS